MVLKQLERKISSSCKRFSTMKTKSGGPGIILVQIKKVEDEDGNSKVTSGSDFTFYRYDGHLFIAKVVSDNVHISEFGQL